MEKGGHPARRITAGINGKVLGQLGLLAGAEVLPKPVDGRTQTCFVGPVEGLPGAGVPQDPGHGTVRLADAEYGAACPEVFEELARQRSPVLGLLAQGQQQDRSPQLLAHGGLVVPVTQIDQVSTQAGRADGLQHLGVGLADQAETQHPGELCIFPDLVCEHLPQNKRIAVGCEETGMGQVEKAVRLHPLLVVVRIVSVRDQMDRRPGRSHEVIPHQRGHGNDGICLVQDGLLQPLVTFLRPRGKA